MSRNRIAILLIGYQRKDFLLQNIKNCLPVIGEETNLYISVDGKLEGDSCYTTNIIDAEVNKFLDLIDPNWLKIRIEDMNYGCDKHIPRAIDWVFEQNSGVIVVEDDVRLSCEMILEIKSKLDAEISNDGYKPIVGMSGISIPSVGMNLWRETYYFTAWGYALSAQFWDIHKLSRERFNRSESVDDFLRGSYPWEKFAERKKTIWRERLKRGNYDYEIQATLFKHSIRVYAPLFRIIDNIGHGALDATHTSHGTPRYLVKKVWRVRRIFTDDIPLGWLTSLLILADANTWAGDGIWSIRGRAFGLRTVVRRTCKSLLRVVYRQS